LKSRFLNAVGFNRTSAEMIELALTKINDATERIYLLEEQSFLWAECENGENALRCADASLELGSTSIRSHYLRGRALALLGQLEEARSEIKHVLATDPENADAQRALPMIDKALGHNQGNRWWQFWKS
jgi:tetratricopeptide (TPR) repeat protein